MIKPQRSSCPVYTLQDHQRVRAFIESEIGVSLPDSKTSLVEGRLRRRVIRLKFKSFEKYLSWVFDTPEGQQERLHMIDALTTNKTCFFREPEQFNYLVNVALKELEQNRFKQARDRLRVWCAGCSSGEEAYTLGIILTEAAQQQRGLIFDILASDISSCCLKRCRQAIYTESQVQPMAYPLKKKYLLKSRDPNEALVQIAPEIRRLIEFRHINLTAPSFDMKDPMDVIFCRNVMIYFDLEVRQALVKRFERQLVSHGYLFIGHSDSLNGLIDLKFEQVAPQVYRKTV